MFQMQKELGLMQYLIQGSTLSDIGNAIRSKTGKSDMITPENMPAEIEEISGGGEIGGNVYFNYINNITCSAIYADGTAKTHLS